MNDVICTVGYALKPKKLRKSESSDSITTKTTVPLIKQWSGGGLGDIINTGERILGGIRFIQWDFDIPWSEQPNFDVIIHKLTDDIDPDGNHHSRVTSIMNYLLNHPQTTLIDPIESVQNVLSRKRTCDYLEILKEKTSMKSSFQLPKYMILNDQIDDIQILQMMDVVGLSFPLISKPIIACGTPNSHLLTIIVSIEGFKLIKYPCIIQQYVNHNSLLYKVYVIDQEVMIFSRPSLPNISHLIDLNVLKNVAFDSSQEYPRLHDFLVDPTNLIPFNNSTLNQRNHTDSNFAGK